MVLECIPHHPFTGDHKPEQNGNASDWQSGEELGLSPALPKATDIEFERDFFLSLGWPAQFIEELEVEARNAKVGLIQAAIASGALNAAEF